VGFSSPQRKRSGIALHLLTFLKMMNGMLSIFAFKKEDSAATIVCTKAEIQTWQKGCRLHSGPLGSAGTPAGTERGSW